VDIEMRPLQKRVKQMGYDIQLTDAARTWLATKGYDVQFGARPLKRLLQSSVEDALCQLILDGKVTEGQTIRVDAAAPDAKELTLTAVSD
jgi:ATP-dependent Clp protease ATP-binding subunit ClpC